MRQKSQLIEDTIDSQKWERTFSGRLTKARYKLIKRYCSKHTKNYQCGHVHDCCGCMYSQHMTFTYKQNQVSIIVTRYYNY